MDEADNKKKGEVSPRDDDHNRDVEDTSKKIPYPKSVFFILIMEFCERFCFYGMKAVLTLYLKNELKFSEDTSTVIYHAFNMSAYFTPLFGAMIADSLLGKFRTIFYLSVVYVAGNIVLSLGSVPPLHLPGVTFAMIGLVLIAIGTGGIKPCVSAFGGDQFVIPQQEVQLAGFFSIFYAAINSGSLVSTFITPIFRKDIKCFGSDSCYPLAFGVPAALMIVALIVFVIGRFMYRVQKPTGNVVVAVGKTIGHALSRKRKLKGDKREHWLDYADDKYGKRDIEDIKILLKILFLYIPLPFFWSLFDQQGSRWTFQASRMDGGLGGFTLKPDQMQVVNPILILAFIPIFENGIYPLLAKCNILKNPLQRLVMGGIFAGVAFCISGIVELELQKTYPSEMSGTEAHLNLINMGTTNFTGNILFNGKDATGEANFIFNSNSDFLPGILKSGQYTIKFKDAGNKEQSFTFVLDPEEKATILFVDGATDGSLELIHPKENTKIEDPEFSVGDKYEKSGEGNPFLSILQSGLWADPDPDKDGKWNADIVKNNLRWDVVVKDAKKEKKYFLWKFSENQTEYTDWHTAPAIEIDPNTFKIYVEEIHLNADGDEMNRTRTLLEDQEIEVLPGGSYILAIVKGKDGKFTSHKSQIIKPNTLHMLWLLPQYIIMTMGEIMFSITIMDFSYTQAPKSMKSVMQSAWLMTVMVGNAIDIIVVEAKFFEEQWKEFFLFAGLMFLDMIIFSYLAYRYTPSDLSKSTDFSDAIKEDDEDEDDDKLGSGSGRLNPTFETDKDQ